MPGQALNAMLKGRTAAGHNPKDIERNVAKLTRAGRSPQMRPQRPDRPARVQRPKRGPLVRIARTDAQSGGGYQLPPRRYSVPEGAPSRKAAGGTRRYIAPNTRRVPTRWKRNKGLGQGPPTQTRGPYDPRRKRWPI